MIASWRCRGSRLLPSVTCSARLELLYPSGHGQLHYRYVNIDNNKLLIRIIVTRSKEDPKHPCQKLTITCLPNTSLTLVSRNVKHIITVVDYAEPTKAVVKFHTRIDDAGVTRYPRIGRRDKNSSGELCSIQVGDSCCKSPVQIL